MPFHALTSDNNAGTTTQNFEDELPFLNIVPEEDHKFHFSEQVLHPSNTLIIVAKYRLFCFLKTIINK